MANTVSEQKNTISIKESRKILGRENKNYTDEQIEKLVQDIAAMARLYIRSVQSDY